VVLHVDHLVPLAAGGPTTADNLVTACEECNLGKATRAMLEVDS
jgi:5-methylcytosine-specific restriction endonuclease McrA